MMPKTASKGGSFPSLLRGSPQYSWYNYPLWTPESRGETETTHLDTRRMEKGIRMERRAASHTEEEELNQRRRLLNLARKGDPKAINRLFELYQVRVFTGEALSKSGRLPHWPTVHPAPPKRTVRKRVLRKRMSRSSIRKPSRAARRTGSPRLSASRKSARKRMHR